MANVTDVQVGFFAPQSKHVWSVSGDKNKDGDGVAGAGDDGGGGLGE